MKGENGVTLISLIIYVMLMAIIIAVISNISASFYSNLNDFDNESESVVAYAKFNMFFLNDIKKDNIKVIDFKDNYIVLLLNNIQIQYSVQNNSLYRNKVKISDNVESVLITTNDYNKIDIYLKIGEYEKTTSYVIEK